jgi:hypothetical protein|nr:MAG TPA: distal tail protein [Caudoviricetes sp.]
MFKTNKEIIVIQAKATTPIPTGVVFWSHDKGTAKMLFQLQKDYVNQTLSEGTIVPICLDFVGGRHIYHAVIEDAINGIVSIVLEDNILGYVGRVTGSIYIELPDSRSLDTAGRFTFDIKRSPIDLNTPELEDYYWQGFNEIIDEYHQTINTIKSEAKALIDSLTADVTTAQSKITQLEQSITTANTNLNARIDEINKKIDDNDVFTKAESSANVINQIGGAESAILKKELLVDGTEGTAQRYIKDIPNLALGDPLYTEYGVVPGQPNLLNDTSSTLTEVSFSSTQYKESQSAVSSLFKVNDTISYAVTIDNTKGVFDVFSGVAFKNIDGTYSNFSGTSVAAGRTGRSMVQVTIADSYTMFYYKPLMKINKNTSTTVSYGKEKLIVGSREAMDEWTPSQSNSGLTIKNNGMVPFTDDEYATLNDPDGIVRAETKIVGRGAEIETPFKIIEVFANRYPDIFGKTTTDAEKITRFKSIQKGVTIKSTLRGSGANASKNGQLYLKYTDGTSEFLVNNQTSEFVEISKTLTATQLDQLSSTGVLTVYATTKRNGTNDAGAISDGVTSALLEVKDLRLIVEIEANGKTIIESIIAANHIENLATEEEAETGEDNKKIMTPLRVMQSIKKFVENKFVSIAGNETIGGLKNFRDGLMVKENTVLTHKGVVTIKYSNADFPTEIASGYITFVRYGDEVQAVFNFKTRIGNDFAKDQSIIWGIAADFQADTSEPQYIGITSTGGTTSIVKFTAGGSTLTAHSILLKDTWYAGTVTYLAKNKL